MAFAPTMGMCFKSKQILTKLVAIFVASVTFGSGVSVADDRNTADFGAVLVENHVGGMAGGVTVGEGFGGITDRTFVTAPPHFLYVVEKERGSFLDCGSGQETRKTDTDGRDEALMRCGVTLTETVVIPAAAQSARIIIHY